MNEPWNTELEIWAAFCRLYPRFSEKEIRRMYGYGEITRYAWFSKGWRAKEGGKQND